jgi:hypothetical protein
MVKLDFDGLVRVLGSRRVDVDKRGTLKLNFTIYKNIVK